MHGDWFRIWWLIFPLIGFGFAFWSIWLSHQRQKAAIDLLRTYASQGKDPPPELVKALGLLDQGNADALVAAKLDRPMYYLRRRQWGRFVVWDHLRKRPATGVKLAAEAQEKVALQAPAGMVTVCETVSVWTAP